MKTMLCIASLFMFVTVFAQPVDSLRFDESTGAGTPFNLTWNADHTELLLSWTQTTEARVEISIADATGRFSITLYLGALPAGNQEKSFQVTALDGGNYTALLRLNDQVAGNSTFFVDHTK